jgi:EthD domain-containing protein
MTGRPVAMTHRFIFVKRKPGMSESEFFTYWKDVHANRYGQKIRQARRYLINMRVPPASGSRESVWDGAAEVWFDNAEAAAEFIQSDEYVHGSRADEPNFLAFWLMSGFDTDDTDLIVGEDQAESHGVKLIQTVKRKEGLSLDAFRDHLVESYGPRLARLPGIRRCTVGSVADVFYGLGEPLLDGICSAWFDDQAAAEQALASREYTAHVQQDVHSFLRPEYVHSMLTSQHWVIGPTFKET